MRKDLTEIVFILDRSGSMSGLEKDTIGGFNSFIAKQREGEGEALLTTVLFNERTSMLHDRVNLSKVELLTDSDYRVGGCTALWDAVGLTIEHIAKIHKYARPEDVPGQTLFVITTDGYENASRAYDLEKLEKLIDKQQKKHDWKFIFLGANIDAVKTARDMGIAPDYAVDFCADSVGMEKNAAGVSEFVACMRCCMPVDESWRKEIDEHYEKQKATGGKKKTK